MRQASPASRFAAWGVYRSALRYVGPGLLACCGLVLIGQASFIHAKAMVAQVLLERAFSASVVSGEPVKPWSWADTWPVARVEVPRIGADSIVLKGASGQALAFGPGHLDGTPTPGDPGWSVLSAHRDTHFAFLGKVRIGDRIAVTRNDGRRVGFIVTGTKVVRWDRSGVVSSAPGTGLVLATCWPLNARTPGPLRYLVFAEVAGASKRVDRPDGEKQHVPVIGEVSSHGTSG
ncbi:MAG: class GN sortase [Alphaproteobacteria bacterium]|nr:class GN sortase [Alphaproteobacteria bacterium]